MQLNFFDHGQDTVLRNGVVHALERRDADATMSAWRRLADEFPDDEMLPPSAVLIDVLDNPGAERLDSHDGLRAARRALLDGVEPAAVRVLGRESAARWLAPLWQGLAVRAAALPFSPDRIDDHAAPLWLRGCAWLAAAQAVADIESWRRIPAPLAWMAEARYRLDGLDAAWTLFAELAWQAPAGFATLARRLADPLLDRLRMQFDEVFEGEGTDDDLTWFPAWVLTAKPALARLLGATPPAQAKPPEQALRLLVELPRLEREGRQHEMVLLRKALRDLHRGLYAAYMAGR